MRYFLLSFLFIFLGCTTTSKPAEPKGKLFEVIPSRLNRKNIPGKHPFAIFYLGTGNSNAEISADDISRGEFAKKDWNKSEFFKSSSLKNCDELENLKIDSANAKFLEYTPYQYRRTLCQIRRDLLKSGRMEVMAPYSAGLFKNDWLPLKVLNLLRPKPTLPDNKITKVVAEGESIYSTYGWQILSPLAIADLNKDGKQEYIFFIVNYASHDTISPSYIAMTLEKDNSLTWLDLTP